MPPPPTLSARSVALSLALGAHPERLGAGQLVAMGSTVGVPPATMRVALTRAVAAGDLRRDADATYALGDRLVARQRRQDEAVTDAERAWDGTWETVVVVVAGRPADERAALRQELAEHRLAELREGVWMRPANLRRAASYAASPVVEALLARPQGEPAGLVRRLWDLDGWAVRGTAALADLERAAAPADRLAAAAALVRHLATDPLLPTALLPPGWPATALRAAYGAYRTELRHLAPAGGERG
ncbi:MULTISPECIES: PaaX family transcriptional regulator C-terminal domain-containing protein [unclassified Nocardioides]|uniref:PaaX family transcriptional regulator C-terminal domain-containing protein n=1 Tax=unclassified Nocardioides TaxID=2615069 RepID=UPI002404E4C7|nr:MULTISPECIES: PaaX family transcriptional regulator C-terminal domain-containing protein [unclassified Nocardioides]